MPLCFCRHDGGIEHMDIKRSGSQPSGKGPSEYFTGTIRLDPLFEAPAPARAVGVSITLEPDAREAWHGATPTTAVTYIAIQEQLDGKVVDWMEPESSEQYQG